MILLLFTMLVSMANYTEDWQGTDRERTVPVRIFLPEDNAAKPFPTVLLSHGLGGNRDGFGYLGDDWAKHGYLVVAMQHPGSDSNIFRAERRVGETPIQTMAKTVNAEEARYRADDVKFILDELERRNQSNRKLAGKIDMNRVAIGGHSFGAQTVFAAVGRLPYKADLRIKAAIVMSPSPTKISDQVILHKNIKTPMLHLTGTNDRSPIQKDFEPKDRRIPFDSMSGIDQYLIIFKDANHLLFSGHPRSFGMTAMEKKNQPIIAEITRRFLDTYLKGEPPLTEKNITELLGDAGSVEIKK